MANIETVSAEQQHSSGSRRHKRSRSAADLESVEEKDPAAGASFKQTAERITKRQCRERLLRIENELTCPLCLELSYCPFLFPCREHIACHKCLLEMVTASTQIVYQEREARCVLRVSHTTPSSGGAELRCPCCQTSQNGFSVWLEGIEPLSHIVNAVFADSAELQCPYCDVRSTMSGLCKHLQRAQCTRVTLPCTFCQQPYAYHRQGLREHMQVCTKIKCPHVNCTFVGTQAAVTEHCVVHKKMTALRRLSDLIHYNMAEWDANIVTGAQQAGVVRTLDNLKAMLLVHSSKVLRLLALARGCTPQRFLEVSNSSPLLRRAFDPVTNRLAVPDEALEFDVDDEGSPDSDGDTDGDGNYEQELLAVFA